MEILDPVWVWIARLALALLFAAAGLSKLRHPAAFRAAIASYELLPGFIVGPTARVLAVTEVGAAVLLLWPAGVLSGGVVLWLLLLVFSMAIAINLWRGRTDIDCGCWMFGSRQEVQQNSIGLGTLVRNASLAGLVLIAVLPAAGRALNILDWLTVLMGTLAALGLFAMAAQLSVNGRRLAALRTARS